MNSVLLLILELSNEIPSNSFKAIKGEHHDINRRGNVIEENLYYFLQTSLIDIHKSLSESTWNSEDEVKNSELH